MQSFKFHFIHQVIRNICFNSSLLVSVRVKCFQLYFNDNPVNNIENLDKEETCYLFKIKRRNNFHNQHRKMHGMEAQNHWKGQKDTNTTIDMK